MIDEKALTKRQSKYLYGIAVLMMVFHHLFKSGGTCSGTVVTIAWLCKICVAIYAFISGYAIYMRLDQNSLLLKDDYRLVLKQILSFYKKYWLVFALYIIVRIFKQNITQSVPSLLFNFIGIRFDYNGAWWYIRQYVFMLLSAPLLIMILKKCKLGNRLLLALMVVISFAFLVGHYTAGFLKIIADSNTLLYMMVFIEGIVAAKTEIVFSIYNSIRKHPLIPAALLALSFVLRIIVADNAGYANLDLLLIIPIICSVIALIDKCPCAVQGATINESILARGHFCASIPVAPQGARDWHLNELFTVNAKLSQ